MKRAQTLILPLAALLAGGVATPVLADDSPHVIGASLFLVSDYRFRGISQTDEGPALQGSLSYSYTPANISLGLSASNVDSSADGYDGASLELDPYLTWAPSWDALSLDVGWVYYNYPHTHYSDNNTHEFRVGAAYDFGMVKPSFTINYSPDWYGTEEAWYFKLALTVPLPEDFSLSAYYGWSRFDDSDADYEDWSIGVGKSFAGLDFALSYVDTASLDTDGCGAPFQCDGTFVLSVGKSF